LREVKCAIASNFPNVEKFWEVLLYSLTFSPIKNKKLRNPKKPRILQFFHLYFKFPMKNRLFWQNWQNPHKIIFNFLLFFFLVSLIGMLISYHFGRDWTLGWHEQTLTNLQPFTVETFFKGIFPIDIEANTYYFQNKFVSSGLRINLIASYIYLLGIGIAFSFLMAFVSQLQKTAYLVLVTVSIFFLIGLRVDLLAIFGSYSKIIVGGLVFSYLALSYYFNTFAKELSLGKKVLSFFALTTLAGIILLSFGKTDLAVLVMANYGLILPIILTILFILVVSSEIPFIFLYLIVRYNPANSSKNLFHFGVIMFFYLGNLVLLYLKNSKTIHWDVAYINDFYLLAVSSVLGIWGIRNSDIFKKYFPASLNYLVFAALGIVAFTTIGYVHATANDPLIACMEDAIVYSHLAFGAVFIFYAVGNFPNYNAPKPMYEVFYDQQDNKKIPLYVMRGVVFLILTGMLLKVDILPYRQAIAGYYNGLGDIYLGQDEKFVSKLYYEKAQENDYYNHRTSYALATLAKLEKDDNNYILFLTAATFRDASPHAYIDLSEKLLDADLVIQATLKLSEGARKFPKNPQIANNLSLLFLRLGQIDSTIHYAGIAQKYIKNSEGVTANSLTYLLKNRLKNSAELNELLASGDNLGVNANRLAVLNSYNQIEKTPFLKNSFPTPDSLEILTEQKFVYLYNFTLNQAESGDSSAIVLLKQYMKNAKNYTEYGEMSRFALAWFYFKQHKLRTSTEQLNAILLMSPRYQRLLGLWALQQGNFEVAIENFVEIEKKSVLPDEKNKYYLAVALTEAQRFSEAEQLWQQIEQNSENITLKNLAKKAKKIIKILQNNKEAVNFTDLDNSEKFAILYYSKNLDDKNLETLRSISAPDLIYRATAILMEQYLQKNDVEKAKKLYDNLDKKLKTSLQAQSEVNLSYLKVLFAKKDYQMLQTNLDKVPLVGVQANVRVYLRALLSENSGNNKGSKQLYDKALEANPFNETIVLEISKFFSQRFKQPEMAYNTLVVGTRFNPNSLQLWKAYAMQALEAKLSNYGKEALVKVKQLSENSDYQVFEKEFTERKNKIDIETYGRIIE
jgi:hypothetical protein